MEDTRKCIGEGVALALAHAGADVVLTSRAVERADPAAKTIREGAGTPWPWRWRPLLSRIPWGESEK